MPRNTFIRLIIIIALLCGGWSGFWLISGTLSKNIISSLLDEGYENWEFSYSDISLRGFPNRTDLRIHDLKLLQQENSTDFTIGNVDILRLVYNWSEFIVSLPPSQKGFINGVEYTIVSEQPRLSLHWNENTPIPLAHLIVELKQIDLNSSDLTSLTLESGLFAIKPDDINPNKFMFHLKSDQINLEIFQDRLTLEPFDFVGNAEVLLSEPTVGQRYKIEEIAVRSLQFDFDAFSINLTGNFTNQNSFPDGTLAIEFVGDKEKFSGLFAIKPDDINPNKFMFHLKSDQISLEIFQDKLTLEPFDFVGNAEVLLSEPTVGQCYKIEEIAVRSLQFDFDAFSINLTGNFTNQNSFPDGTLAIEFVGDKEKFFELLVANGLLSPPLFFVAANLPIDSYEFQLKGGEISILNLFSKEFPLSFPEIC